MKISFEFKDIRDMMLGLPKFMKLVGTDAPFEERMAAALEPDPTEMIIRVTPKDGAPFTADEKDKLQALLLDFVKDPEGFAEKHADEAPAPAKEPEKKNPKTDAKPEKTDEKEAKNDAKPEKTDAKEVKETEVRAAFSKLIKAGKRDKVKEILSGFGADNLPALAPEHYAEALKLAKEAAE